MTDTQGKRERPIEDLQAGYAFRETLVPMADFQSASGPAWFGWAIMEAFLAGLDHARTALDNTRDE